MTCLIFFVSCGGSERDVLNPLQTVEVIDSDTVWLVTRCAEVRSIKRGGITSEMVGMKISTLDFIDRNLGWVLLADGMIKSTSDGGISGTIEGFCRHRLTDNGNRILE